VTTDELGEVDFTASISTVIDESAYLTATATDDNTGSTSEFSRCLPAGYTVLDSDDLITSEPVPVGPGGGPGFILRADPAGGPQPASVLLCSVSPIRMTAGDRITVGCSSAIIEVVEGEIEIQLDDNTQAIVPTDAVVTVEEVEGGQVQIQNDSPAGTEPVQIAPSAVTLSGRSAAGNRFWRGPSSSRRPRCGCRRPWMPAPTSSKSRAPSLLDPPVTASTRSTNG
jgi:hypothetical protein